MAIDTAELRYYTATEVAGILRFNKQRTFDLIASGAIRSIRIGRTIRVSVTVRCFRISAGRPATVNDEVGYARRPPSRQTFRCLRSLPRPGRPQWVVRVTASTGYRSVPFATRDRHETSSGNSQESYGGVP
jgi:hypothetical protein